MKTTSRSLFVVALLITLMMATGMSAADAGATLPIDTSSWLSALYVAVTSREWSVLVGLVFVGVVFLIRKVGPDVVKTKLGGLLLSIGVALFSKIGIALAAGVKPDLSLVMGALATAAESAGLWEWLKDHLPSVQAAAAKVSAPDPDPTKS